MHEVKNNPEKTFETNPLQKEFQLLNLSLFKATSFLLTAAPIISEFAIYYFKGAIGESFFSSLTMVLATVSNYVWFLKTKNLKLALKVTPTAQVICYLWGLSVSGGVHAEQLVYMPMIPIIFGYTFGKKGTLYSTVVAVTVTIALVTFEKFGGYADRKFIQSFGLLGYQAIGATGFTAFLVTYFQLQREKFEKSILKMNQQLVEDKMLAQKNEKAIQILFNNAPIAIAQIGKDLKLVAVNTTYCQFMGYTESELIGKSILELTHPEDKQATTDLAFKNGKEMSSIVINKLEKRYLHKSGKTIWGSVTLRGVKLENESDYTLFSSILDITTEKERNDLLSLTLDTMVDGFVVHNSTGEISSFNTSALEILELTADQLTGRTSKDPRWGSIDQDGNPMPGEKHPAMVALSTGEKVKNTIMGIKLPSGDTRWLRINATPYLSKENRDRQVIVNFSDVSDLIASRDENKFILDELQIGVWKYDPIERSFFLDRSMYKLFGISESSHSSANQAWKSALTEAENKKVITEINNAILGEKEFNFLFEIQTNLRGKRLISARGKVGRDQFGSALIVYGVSIDVTEQKQSEAEREKLTKLLEAVLQNVPSMIFVKDYNKGLSFSLLNRSGEKLLGLSESQLIGKSDSDFFPKEQAEFFKEKDRQVFENKGGLRINKEAIETPQGTRYLSTYKIPTFDEKGNPHLLIGISDDITEQLAVQDNLELERAKSLRNAKLASLGEMSAGIAHEINNPLAIILGGIEVLAKFKDDSEKFKHKIDMITKSCERISKIVNGLKKFSRSDQQKNHLPHSLCEIAKEVQILTAHKSKRHSTEVFIECQSLAQVLCDEVEIEQVLINLVNNAIDAVKSREERWVKVKVMDATENVIVSVSDSGPGISEEIKNKLFQPFFTTKKVGEGTGLGLSIAKGILDDHHATISIDSDLPHTCFEIRFPKIVVNPNGQAS